MGPQRERCREKTVIRSRARPNRRWRMSCVCKSGSATKRRKRRMLERSLRTAVLELHQRQVGVRRIARTLKISRQAVRRVIASQRVDPPLIRRREKAEPYRKEILELHSSCQGNLVRVHE